MQGFLFGMCRSKMKMSQVCKIEMSPVFAFLATPRHGTCRFEGGLPTLRFVKEPKKEGITHGKLDYE